MPQRIQKIKAQIQKIKHEKTLWIYGSLVMLIFITSVILYWEQLWTQQRLLYVLIPVGLPVIAGWWYWTMNIMGKLLEYKSEEISILESISSEIKKLKKNLSDISQK